MRNRVLYGFGGVKNFGDDYILDQWISYYFENRPDLKLFAARPDTWLSGYYFDKSNFAVMPIFQQKYWRIVRELRKNNHDQISSSVEAGKLVAFEMLASDSDYRDFLECTEAFHFIGGGYLNKIFADVWGIASCFITISDQLQIPVFGTGLGLTPSITNRKEIDRIVERFTVLESRDVEGYEEFKARYPRLAIFSGSDDSFITPVKRNLEIKKKSIFVCVQSDLRDDKNHARILSKCLRMIQSTNNDYEVSYIQLHDGPDSIFFHKLNESLGGGIRRYTEKDILRDGLPISSDDICITTRFHLHLLAARLGARGAYVWTGDDYYRIKHKSVNDLGSGWLDFLSNKNPPESVLSTRHPSIDDSARLAIKNKFVNENIIL